MESETAPPIATPDSSLTIRQLPSGADRLVLACAFPDRAPALLFACWTQPELLQQWWPPAAEIEPRLGGIYHFTWPARDWHLRGRYTVFVPERQLAFTWHWDHDPADASTTQVNVAFYPSLGGGAVLTLIHGPYPDTPAGRDLRAEHLDGWTQFLTRLQQLGPSPA
jgi:uncharacterized protein YndB with AHSA1/START domain